MDGKKKTRTVYISARQKKKLLEFITKHPELISCKVTQGFTYKDSQKLWHIIANECNALPGARKSWRQWKKTWQDMRSNAKKRQSETNGELPSSIVILTPAEQEALGIRPLNVTSTSSQQDTEYVTVEDNLGNYDNEVESNASISEPESLPESKIFTRLQTKISKNSNSVSATNHSSNCVFNCEVLAVQEQKKIEIKEDYILFKKDYLRQKLKLIKEQTEALKIIAKELAK